MHIHTVVPDKQEYIRVIGSIDDDVNHLVGMVGKVNAYSDDEVYDKDYDLIFVDLGNVSRVFNTKDVEYITKKEYFKGCLSG